WRTVYYRFATREEREGKMSTNLMNKLDTIGFDNKKDLLISVGDLVDRGAENVECLELITFPWFRAVRGNHEQMMIDGLS
ncbi:metallophosphoesterase, partial [Pseudomonas aeruginosa]